MGRKVPLDPRSTQRKRARKILFRSGIDYVCVDCKCSPERLPPDAPRHLRLALVGKRTVSGLQANHINKVILDNDLVNLEWLCPSCHKKKDKQTKVGESLYEDEHGYSW